MPMPAVSEEILRERVKQYQRFNCNAEATARALKISSNTLKAQLQMFKRRFPEEDIFAQDNSVMWTVPSSHNIDLTNSTVLVGGDLHIWPGQTPLMWQAFVAVAKNIKPNCIVLNGDILDGARVSRHGSLLGVAAPKVSAEIEAAQELIGKLPRTQHRVWTIGNHDQRVDNYLANNAPELDDYSGRLSDRFPLWHFCYSVVINKCEIRHRFRAGIHAGYNNALNSGVSVVSNHTHQLQVTAIRNRLGTHWGVEAGMLGDPMAKQFEYTEGAPNRAQEGFVVLTFDEDGDLLPPETCEMVKGHPIFRGKRVF